MSRHIRSTAPYRAAVGIHRADGPRRGGPACENDWRGAGLSCVPIAPSSLAEVQRIEVCAVDEHTVTVKVVALLGGATLLSTACPVVPGQDSTATREPGGGS
jgi:hypothetical protein